jgi:hypothetical protein
MFSGTPRCHIYCTEDFLEVVWIYHADLLA